MRRPFPSKEKERTNQREGNLSSILVISPSVPGLHQHIQVTSWCLRKFTECWFQLQGVSQQLALGQGKLTLQRRNVLHTTVSPHPAEILHGLSQRLRKCCFWVTLSRGSIALIIRGSIANYIILFKIIPIRQNVYGTGNVFWVTVPDVGSSHCPGCLRGLCQAGKSEIPNSFRTGKCFSFEWSIERDFYTWVFIAWSQQKKGITLDCHMKWAQK